MEQELSLSSLKAFNLIRRAALEYNNEEYKFYNGGFIKYSIQGKSIFIADIYIEPELRGTPVSSIILSQFHDFIEEEGMYFIYGYVMKGSSKFNSRVDTFKSWGLSIIEDHSTHVVISAPVSSLKGGSSE